MQTEIIDKSYLHNTDFLAKIIEAIDTCSLTALQNLKTFHHFTVEQVWAIENAHRIIELLCRF